MGWFVLDKYYFKTDETPVYSVALLLHPSVTGYAQLCIHGTARTRAV